MFIFALRDTYGLKIAIWLILVWNLNFLVAVYVGNVWLSFMVIALAVAATCYGSFLLCKHRADLIFSSNSAKEHAFPSSRKIAQFSFQKHLLPLVLFLLLVPVTISISNNPELDVKLGLIFLVYQICLAGVVGLTHHLVRSVVDRRAKQTKSI